MFGKFRLHKARTVRKVWDSRIFATVAFAVLSACSTAPVATGISDPYETANRRVFEENMRLDAALFSGKDSQSDAQAQAPQAGADFPLRRVYDFAANVGLPSRVVNDILQGNVEDAVHNSVRLVFNSTLGLGGLFDVATDIGLEERSTDFGETLHVWGVPEGNFVMLPVLGPSTDRDTVGMVVDLFTNPLSYLLPGAYAYLPLEARIASLFTARLSYGDALDDLLYGSTDPYATARLYYLDNRRYQLVGDDATDEALYDIYEEAYE